MYSSAFSLLSVSSVSFTPMFCPPIRPNAIAKNSNELASISTVTDYDVWAEKPVTAKEVMVTLSKNVQNTKKILTNLICINCYGHRL